MRAMTAVPPRTPPRMGPRGKDELAWTVVVVVVEVEGTDALADREASFAAEDMPR